MWWKAKFTLKALVLTVLCMGNRKKKNSKTTPPSPLAHTFPLNQSCRRAPWLQTLNEKGISCNYASGRYMYHTVISLKTVQALLIS